MDHQTNQNHYPAVRRVLLWILFANLSVTALKLILGFLTGALAVVADGFHSLVDASSNLIGLAAVRLADRPADDAHPYGYRRYETVGSLAIGGMLIVAAWEIAQQIIERTAAAEGPDITPLTLVLVVLTFPINLLIYNLEMFAGRRLNSEILISDATHTRTDLFVTASVAVGLIGVFLGLPWLDLVVAAGVLVVILRAAYQIVRDAAGWLTDAAAADPLQVKSLAESVPGVMDAHDIRSRGSPDAAFVDLHIVVPSGMSTEQAHAVASEVEEKIQELPAVVDAIVHVEPTTEVAGSDWEKIAYHLRQTADGMGLGLHDLHIHKNVEGDYALELHLELPGDISLGEAHELTERFETRISRRLPPFSTIITHMEPLPEIVLEPDIVVDPGLISDIRAYITRQVGEEQLLELLSYMVGGHVSIAVRICTSAEVSLTDAHRKAEELELGLRAHFPHVVRVVVHVEPPS